MGRCVSYLSEDPAGWGGPGPERRPCLGVTTQERRLRPARGTCYAGTVDPRPRISRTLRRARRAPVLPGQHDRDHRGPAGGHGTGSLAHWTGTSLPASPGPVVHAAGVLPAQALPLVPPAQIEGHEGEAPLGPRGPPLPRA